MRGGTMPKRHRSSKGRRLLEPTESEGEAADIGQRYIVALPAVTTAGYATSCGLAGCCSNITVRAYYSHRRR